MNTTYKILISIGLIVVIPFLVTCYLYMGLSPVVFQTGGLVVSITAVIIVLGVITLLELSLALRKLSRNLKEMAGGSVNHKAEVEKSSGAESMTLSISQISLKLRENADELEKRAILIERFDQEVRKRGYLQKIYYSDAAHELLKPLVNIDMGSLLLLEKKGGILNAEQEQLLKIVNKNATRLTRLINNLLDISKLESGWSSLKYEPFDIEDMIDESVNSLDKWRQQKEVGLEKKISQNLPKVFADRDRIIQVVINLLSNAIKFTPPGGRIGVEAKVFREKADLKLSEDGEVYVEVSVRDTGIGIPELQREKIFERFRTLEQESVSDLPSTGLGLSIAARIIKMHGGKIWADSHQGRGSKFTFIIPQGLKRRLERAEKEEIEKETKEPAKVMNIERGIMPEAKLIMVVDDEEVVRNLLCSFLQKRGYKTVALGDGESAISYAEKNKPDLVLLDISMPGLDGIETCDRLKEVLQASGDVEIIIITGYPSIENVKKSYVSGATDIIRKPFDLEDIDRRINQWFHREKKYI